MELDDCAFPLMESIAYSDDPRSFYEGCSVRIAGGLQTEGSGMGKGSS